MTPSTNPAFQSGPLGAALSSASTPNGTGVAPGLSRGGHATMGLLFPLTSISSRQDPVCGCLLAGLLMGAGGAPPGRGVSGAGVPDACGAGWLGPPWPGLTLPHPLWADGTRLSRPLGRPVTRQMGHHPPATLRSCGPPPTLGWTRRQRVTSQPRPDMTWPSHRGKSGGHGGPQRGGGTGREPAPFPPPVPPGPAAGPTDRLQRP